MTIKKTILNKVIKMKDLAIELLELIQDEREATQEKIDELEEKDELTEKQEERLADLQELDELLYEFEDAVEQCDNSLSALDTSEAEW